MAGRVGRFVIRKDGDAPKNLFDNEEQTSNPALAERTRRANPLYAKVPATRLEAKPESNVSGLTGLAMSLAARHPLQSDSDPGSQKSKFDDTELEDSTISSLDGISQEQWAVHKQHHTEQYGDVDDNYHGLPNPMTRNNNDDDHQNGPYFRNFDQVQVNPALLNEISEARKHGQDNLQYYESRHPNILHNPVAAVRSASPAATFRDRPLSRPRSPQKALMPPPSPKPQKSSNVLPPIITATTTHTTAFDKTSSYTDSSANTTPPPPPTITTATKHKPKTKKRLHHSDLLDHDPVTLKRMSFSDLTHESFDLDPRQPPPPPNPTATAESTHSQALTTLKSLSPSSRSNLFSSQTQPQWSASTTYFENRLADLFKQLRAARERRRDLAIRFEGEVAARMGVIKARGEGIERCLGEIRGKARGVLPGR